MKRMASLPLAACLLFGTAGCESGQDRIYESAVGSGGAADLTSEEVSALSIRSRKIRWSCPL